MAPVIMSTSILQILISNTFLQLKEPRLLREIADSQNGVINMQDEPGTP